MNKGKLEGRWALILGASSGFGAATARALASAGMHIFGVHLDMKATLHRAEQVVADIEALGRGPALFRQDGGCTRRATALALACLLRARHSQGASVSP